MVSASRLLGLPIAEPASFRPEPGFFGWMRSGLTDQPAWRARGYFIAKAPVELASLAAVVTLRAGSLIFLASPIEWAANVWTRQVVIGGVTHRYVASFGSFYFDTWPSMALATAIGIAGWWLSPWVLRGILHADKALAASLLGPSPLSVRVRQLERSRAQAVEGAEARLRDLARGVHPPILDQGLGAALSSLAGKSPVPVVLSVSLPARPSPAIEATVYFCAAELLTNAVKHADATQASIEVSADGSRLRARVSDDGCGGARARGDGGLSGLAARLQSVDGTLEIASPPGGPTVIEIAVPHHG